MKNSILVIAAMLTLPALIIAQEGNASLWENEARISGSYNSVLGEKAGASTQGKGNVYIGNASGVENRMGDGNVFLGYQSGAKEGGSNLLYIENTESDKPLIWGDFKADFVNVNGKLGVGTTSPIDAVDVRGNVRSSSKFVITGIGAAQKTGTDMLLWSVKNMYLGSGSSNNKHITINTQGSVGIGTTTPDEKLAVNGKIHTKEVRVDLNGWPDYVFENDYTLPSLEEVEKHINTNGHLKNIPSAKTVKEQGIHLGEMNAKLLEKIEELTLYAIQQQKELNNQKEKNNSLEQRLKKLEVLIKD